MLDIFVFLMDEVAPSKVVVLTDIIH